MYSFADRKRYTIEPISLQEQVRALANSVCNRFVLIQCQVLLIRVLAAFITCLDSKPCTVCPTDFLLVFFVCSLLSAASRETLFTYTRGKKAIDLFDLNFRCLVHSRTLRKRLLETRLSLEPRALNEHYSWSRRTNFLRKKVAQNENSGCRRAFASNSSHRRATVCRLRQFSNYMKEVILL